MDKKSKKSELRTHFLQIRRKLSDKKSKLKSREICHLFYSNISLKNNSKIAFYTNVKGEPDLSLLMELYQEDGHTLCLPCVEEENAAMTFREYKIGANLQKNRKLGFLEPPKHYPTVIPNVIITPLVAFDAKGNRLGQGGGYYDRTFNDLKGFTEFIAIGTAFKEQQADYIPPETYDYQLDAIVTDERIITS